MRKLGIAIIIFVTGAAAFVILRFSRDQPLSPPGVLKIVSLAPNVTEILFALNRGDVLVGVTDRCNYPPAASKIGRVSGFGTPNEEKILVLRPSIVIACGLENPKTAEVLRQAHIRFVNVQKTGFLSSFSELFAAIDEIGDATGRSVESRELVAGMQAELFALSERIGCVDGARRPRVFVEIEESPLMTAGASSFIDDLIVRAGGRNVAHELTAAYPQIGRAHV
jgi:iron complex transport system substrate-binding protein